MQRERAGEFVRNAEQDTLAAVSKHGDPLIVAVSLDEQMLDPVMHVALTSSYSRAAS